MEQINFQMYVCLRDGPDLCKCESTMTFQGRHDDDSERVRGHPFGVVDQLPGGQHAPAALGAALRRDLAVGGDAGLHAAAHHAGLLRRAGHPGHRQVAVLRLRLRPAGQGQERAQELREQPRQQEQNHRRTQLQILHLRIDRFQHDLLVPERVRPVEDQPADVLHGDLIIVVIVLTDLWPYTFARLVGDEGCFYNYLSFSDVRV